MIWFSASLKPKIQIDENTETVPILEPFISQITILILLMPKDRSIILKLLKDHDLHPVEDLNLKLDPKILLITKE